MAKNFIKNCLKHGFIYAISIQYMYVYEDIKNPMFKKILSKLGVEHICNLMYDYSYNLDYPVDKQDKEVEECQFQHNEIRYVTPCGCRLFNDCRECSSYGMCE